MILIIQWSGYRLPVLVGTIDEAFTSPCSSCVNAKPLCNTQMSNVHPLLAVNFLGLVGNSP